MNISQKEVKDYANATSENIFGKPLTKLTKVESITLRLSFVASCIHDEIDDDLYYKLDDFVKDIIFPDPRNKKQPKQEEKKEA